MPLRGEACQPNSLLYYEEMLRKDHSLSASLVVTPADKLVSTPKDVHRAIQTATRGVSLRYQQVQESNLRRDRYYNEWLTDYPDDV